MERACNTDDPDNYDLRAPVNFSGSIVTPIEYGDRDPWVKHLSCAVSPRSQRCVV